MRASFGILFAVVSCCVMNQEVASGGNGGRDSKNIGNAQKHQKFTQPTAGPSQAY